MNHTWDVVVAGAGPAGAASALLLARAGYRVALLDRAHFPRPKACAEYLNPGVCDVMRRLGLGHVLSEGTAISIPGMEIISPAGRRMRVDYERHGVPLSAASLPRTVLDSALVDAAAGAGAEVIEGFTARRPEMDGNVVSGVVGTYTRRELVLRAQLLVVADGGRSVLAAALGLAQGPHWPVRMGLVAHYSLPRQLPGGFGQMHVAPGGYCGVAPMPGGVVNVAAVVPIGAVRESGVPAQRYLASWIDRHPALRATMDGGEAVTSTRGLFPVGSRSKRAAVPGALLVGDAAGFFDPFTGEGIFRALRSAELAFEVGDQALRDGTAGSGALAVYDRRRATTFRSKSAVTALVQLFVRYPALMEYGLQRLPLRKDELRSLNNVLGDIAPARTFLNPRTMWAALRP